MATSTEVENNIEDKDCDAGPTNLDCILSNLWLGKLRIQVYLKNI